MLKEFKEFALKGNLLDIAIGFVMGAAFKTVVTAFTGGIVSPLIGLLFNADFKELKCIVKEGVKNAEGKIEGEISVLYGEFITSVIDFIIVAFVMFLIVKAVNKFKRKEEEAPA
jgi:large conductance mechanosensitive channel